MTTREEQAVIYKDACQTHFRDGFRAGQEHALKAALKAIDGVSNGAQCAQRIAIMLLHLQDGEPNPLCPRCQEPGFNAAVGCDGCGNKNPNPEESDA